jgi:hypothetical protein
MQADLKKALPGMALPSYEEVPCAVSVMDILTKAVARVEFVGTVCQRLLDPKKLRFTQLTHSPGLCKLDC